MHRRALLASLAGFTALPMAPWQAATDMPAAPSSAAMTGGLSDPAFGTWLADFRTRALAAGWGPALLDLAFAGVTADPHVIALDQHQPELTKPVGDYVSATVSDARVAQGQTKLAAVRPQLHRAEDSTGVPIEVLAAIWGMETAYGAIQGSDDVIRSLATLAAKGRRRPWAEAQLTAALTMLKADDVSRAGLRGSWAGAMGQTQFTPQDYLDYAVDGDGDGRRDIWGSAVDALASSANFLSRKAAWRAEEDWLREVRLPDPDAGARSGGGFDYALAEGPARTTSQWAALGVRPADGRGFRPEEAENEVATLLLPMGWRGPAFLAFPNFHAIMAYNNSTKYALAVGLLAQRIGGAGPLVQAWPADPPISRDDGIAAQTALLRQGFDPGVVDGVLGAGTRKAARAWQAARGLPADGYLSWALVQRLKGEGGGAPPPAGAMAPVA